MAMKSIRCGRPSVAYGTIKSFFLATATKARAWHQTLLMHFMETIVSKAILKLQENNELVEKIATGGITSQQ